MEQCRRLFSQLLTGQPPGLRALGRFWAAVGLTLGLGAAVLGYFGSPEEVAARIPSASATLASDRATGAGSQIAEAESARTAMPAIAAPSTRLPIPPEPPPDAAVAGIVVWPSRLSAAGAALDSATSRPIDNSVIDIRPSNSMPIVESPRRLRISTGGLEITRPEDPDGDGLTVTISALPRGMIRNGPTVLKTGDRLQPQELATLAFVPEPGFTGAAGTLRYLVEDGHGGRAESTVEIDVIDAAETAASAALPISSLRVALATDRGPRPAYHVGDSMTLHLQPTQDAYLYCYYQDDAGRVSRIFPNRFQPDAFVPARVQVAVPPAGNSAFSIRFEQPGALEQVACLAVDREAGPLLPPELIQLDLEPLPLRGLDNVVQRFRSIPGVRVDHSRLSIEVIQRRADELIPSRDRHRRSHRPDPSAAASSRARTAARP